MRRGGPRGRGNRPMQQRFQQQNQNQQIRPLMSGNLQGLKDIDMELELLKRKREIIEQQNEMLSSSYKPRKDYDQPFNQSRENRYDDYTRLYDDRPRDSYSGGGGGGSSSRKRQYIPVWENETPPKRFSAPSVKRDQGSRLGPEYSNPRSNFQRPAVPRSAAPKPLRTRAAPPQKRREFNPTKVAKPSSAAPPVKLSSYKSPAERKKLVTESLADSSVKLRAAPSSIDEWVLRADVEPSRQLNGRLELALGAIIKELRIANPQSEELFAKSVSIRAMKKVVRDRIWKIMVGKEVTSPENVKAAYYDTYPSEDNDIIMKGLEAQKGTDLAAIQSDDPEQYFRQNIHRLMTSKLEEMLLKIKEEYTEKNRNIHARRKYYQKKLRTETAPNTVDTQPQAEATDEPQCENAQPETDKTEPKPEDGQSQADEKVVSVQEPDQVIDVDSTLIKTNEAAPTEKASAVESTHAAPNLEPISNKQYEAFDKLTTYTMGHMIRRFTPVFLKTMEVDEMYIRIKGNILNETRKKFLGTSNVNQPSQKKHVSQSTPQKSPKEKIILAPLHYVKILGKPGLPKRKAMETFFEQFKPRTIKKHKTIHNLLFVGLTSKKDFDDILAADGTVIGRYTLSIKISERSDNKGKPNNSNDSVAGVENISQVNESGSENMESNVDEQVTHLTSTNNGDDLYNPFDDVDTADSTDDQYVKNENGDQTATTEDVTETDKKEAIVNEYVEFKDDQDGDNEVAITEDDHEVVEIKYVPQVDGETETGDCNEEKDDVVVTPVKAEVKDGKGTPIRASVRLSTPGGIITRRMSKQVE